MKIIIINTDDYEYLLPATSVNKGLVKKYSDLEIDWIVNDHHKINILKYSRIKNIWTTGDFPYKKDKYDVLINLSNWNSNLISKIDYNDGIGLFFDDNNMKYYDCLYGDKQLNMNLFQIFFKLCGMSWKGEGYDLNYFPKEKCKKNYTGIAVAHLKIRTYIKENISLENNKISVVPYKNNILKYMDEINKFQSIITDNLKTLHLSLFLKKNIQFLKTTKFNYSVELFSDGQIHNVPSIYLR